MSRLIVKYDFDEWVVQDTVAVDTIFGDSTVCFVLVNIESKKIRVVDVSLVTPLRYEVLRGE